jgi:Tol biopolymer transport system component
MSDESGRPEIYVRDTSSAGGRWQISTTGGDEPSWSRDGRELYYRDESRLMVVAIDTRGAFKPGTPAVLFEGVYNLRSDTGISYDLHPRGDRFLMVRLTDENVASAITVVTNWFADLKRLMSSAP